MNLSVWINQYKLQLIIGLFGLFLMIIGIYQAVSQESQNSKVEIISKDQKDFKEIIIDVSGAVEKPGVYKFSDNSRINDALISAGGLSASADRSWVSRFINLAGKLEDGMKIYIPFQGENTNLSNSSINSINSIPGTITNSNQNTNNDPTNNDQSISINNKVNINTSSISKLDSLWGIGEKRAKDIIDNRPYSNINELLTKTSIPQNVFDRISNNITAF